MYFTFIYEIKLSFFNQIYETFEKTNRNDFD